MTPAQLAHAAAEREGVPADAEQSAAIRDQEIRRVVAELIARSQGLARGVEQSRLSAHPVDLTPGIVGMLQALAVATALRLDDDLRSRGLAPALVFRVPVERGDGNGAGEGPRLVVEA